MKQPAFDPVKELSENVRSRFFIGGEWLKSHGTGCTSLVTPSTEEILCDAPLADLTDVQRAVDAARTAFDSGPWGRMSGKERATYIRKLATATKARLPLLTRLWTAQVGAPVGFAGMFAGIAPGMLEYYASVADSFAFEDVRKTAQGHARVVRQPLGVAALIAPWNAQSPILAYKLGAALAAGCTVVVKSSPETPFDTLVLAECAEEAGLPPGVLNVITADREEGAALVASPKVDKVSFTGSTAAGKQIAKVCIDRMARFTLELGGKSAAIVLDDAQLEPTLGGLAQVTMPFSGQICFAQTRVLVPRSRQDEFLQAYAGLMSGLTVGDPWDEATHLGPLSSRKQYDRVMGYIETGRKEGARLVTGGFRSEGFERGYFIEPTVFADVTPDMIIAKEEIFGPVVVVMAYDDIDDAVRIANDSDFGLSGTVFTSFPERGVEVARRIRTGNITVNGLEMAPNVPFGGFKQSGLGREGGLEGLDAFLESQAIYLPGT
jgi:aldehyde dehydrogenase (NAD+)